MIEKEDLPSSRLQKLQQRLAQEYPTYDQLHIREINTVRIATTTQSDSTLLEQLVNLYPSRPSQSNACYQIAEFVMDHTPALDSIHSREPGAIVQGPHCINFGRNYLIDVAARPYFGSHQFDILVLPLPYSSTNLQDYTNFARFIYGGSWQYLGKKGHLEMEERQAAAWEKHRQQYGTKEPASSLPHWMRKFFSFNRKSGKKQ